MRFFLKYLGGGIFVLAAAFATFLGYAIRPAVEEKKFPSAAVVEFPEFKARTEVKAPSRLKLVTYNIGYASGDKNNLGNVVRKNEVEKNLADMGAALKKLEPDLIALQEVDFDSQRSFGIDQFRSLAKALEMPYGAYVVTWNKNYVAWPYWPPSRNFGRIVSGQAILSRFPIVAHRQKILPKPESNPFWYNWFYLERILEKIEVKAGDETWTVFNVHLEAFDAQRRLDQLALLTEEVKSSALPTRWVLGDFNLASWVAPGAAPEESDNTGGLKKFAEATDLQIAEGPAVFLSMPALGPVKKIDHIFYPAPFQLQASGNIPDLQASDHLPVWAELTHP